MFVVMQLGDGETSWIAEEATIVEAEATARDWNEQRPGSRVVVLPVLFAVGEVA